MYVEISEYQIQNMSVNQNKYKIGKRKKISMLQDIIDERLLTGLEKGPILCRGGGGLKKKQQNKNKLYTSMTSFPKT